MDRVPVVSCCQLKASRRMLLNSRVFAHDSSVPASHISNNCIISRNISCLTWSPICLPPPPPSAFHFGCSCLSNLPSAYRHVPVQKMHRQLCIISHAVQHNPQSALFSALLSPLLSVVSFSFSFLPLRCLVLSYVILYFYTNQLYHYFVSVIFLYTTHSRYIAVHIFTRLHF